MPYTDALYMKAILTEELQRHSGFPLYLDSLVESMINVQIGRAMFDMQTTGEEVRTKMLNWLTSSETFYVSPDMIKVAIAAAETLPNDSVILPHTVPTLRGFAWLPEPFRVVDVRGKILSMSAVLWAVYGGKVHVWWFTDKYDKVDSSNLQMLHRGWDMTEIPRLNPMHHARVEFGEPLPVALELRGQRLVAPDTKVDVLHDKETNQISWVIHDEGLSAQDMEPTMVPAREMRFLTVLWRLMGQTLVDIKTEDRIPKNVRRQVDRANLPDKKVSVVLLRHQTTEHDEGREVRWTHRWLVRGYWRRQWYGSGESRYAEHIWIHPHVKGPEGAPLLVRDVVNALVR